MLTQVETTARKRAVSPARAARRLEIQARLDAYEDANADYAVAVVGYRAEASALREALAAMGVTMTAFAGECGCSPSNVSSYLSPTSVYPLPGYIWKRAQEMGLLCWG